MWLSKETNLTYIWSQLSFLILKIIVSMTLRWQIWARSFRVTFLLYAHQISVTYAITVEEISQQFRQPHRSMFVHRIFQVGDSFRILTLPHLLY